ncbi:MAG: phosphoribosyl-AMP cyclohydrolase [Deltaproteobacteria bacterium]|jgi:phosphoribosyl-AMP cyclohydrolase|nr:phosphoribosyl-AMP cyclohydrolase [Deltaproteobacteria bacterium]
MPKEDLKKKTAKLEPDFDKSGGLVPAVAQDHLTGEILMLAYMNRKSYEKTLATGQVHYYSRSRQELWHKGGGSGNVQLVKELYLDCDLDAIVVKIEQVGGVACHTGNRSCFHFKNISGSDYEIIED